MAICDALLYSIKVQGLEETRAHDGTCSPVYGVDWACHGVVHDSREGAELIKDASVVIGTQKLGCAWAANRRCKQGALPWLVGCSTH